MISTLLKCRTLIWSIMSSSKGSIGSIDNVYLPQLSRKMVEDLEKEVSGWLKKAGKFDGIVEAADAVVKADEIYHSQIRQGDESLDQKNEENLFANLVMLGVALRDYHEGR